MNFWLIAVALDLPFASGNLPRAKDGARAESTAGYETQRCQAYSKTQLSAFLLVYFAKTWLGVPSGPRRGRLPLSYPYYLQVSLGMLSRGEGLSQPCPGPNRQHQSLLSHCQNLRSSPSIAQQPLQLQERKVQRAQELGVGQDV